MSQDLFDEVVAAASRDASIDKGWAEIKTASGSKAEVETIFKSLQELYWEGTAREIASAIVALADFDEFQPEALLAETPKKEELLSSDKFSRLLDLWNPFDGVEWPKEVNSPKPTTGAVQKNVEESVSEYFENQPFQQRRARSLLQCLGLLDIDFVREHRQPSFRSWGQRPQVDYEKDGLLLARQCSECRHCIRSFHFYQCVEGCLDYGHQRNMAKMKPVGKGREQGSFNTDSMNDIMHQFHLSYLVREEPPYRLCPACLVSSSHPREHLRAIRGFAKSGDVPVMEFARELDIWEDHLDGRSLLSLGTIVLDKLALGPRNRLSSRYFFPAGNAHSAMMFGPLLLENGMTRDPGGALISFRNIPNFTASSSKDLMEFLATPSDWKLNNEGEEVVHNTLLSVSADRRLYTAAKPVKERRFMSSRKQVAGGLFTGQCSRFINDENYILNAFLASAEVWKVSKSGPSTTQAEHRRVLKHLADKVTDFIKNAFDYEVNKNLLCFATRLQKHTKLQYNRITNNCQDFCNAMLLNDDVWDSLFSATYPPAPSNRIHESEHVHFRYMMSFAGKMLHPMDEIPFVNPLISSFPLYDSFGQNDADLVDHVTSIRLKMDPHGFGLTLSPSSHDDILLKDSELTCPETYGKDGMPLPRKPCTQASHVLDGPHDNLSVLTFHVHRQRPQYTIPSPDPFQDEFLSTRGPKAWIVNRLEVLHRLLLLNTYLASTASQFQSFTTPLSYRQLEKSWRPPPTMFARAWYSNKRNGTTLERPAWVEETRNERSVGGMYNISMLQTHPFMQTPDVWKTRLAGIKRRLFDESKDKTGVFKETPWTNCTCKHCVYIFSLQNCYRAHSYAASLKDAEPERRTYSKNHPDYVPLERLRASIQNIEEGNTAVDELFSTLEETPEYFDAK